MLRSVKNDESQAWWSRDGR